MTRDGGAFLFHMHGVNAAQRADVSPLPKESPVSTDRRPTVHLVANAHLDPVWQWRWEEGAHEAIATFRTAVQLLEEYPEFIFVHNEAVLYEWIEQFDPELFEDIRRLVGEGRWHISGGWYLQPDCNLAGGESYVRHALVGKAYFREKFGVDVRVAYNLDAFGHNGGFPQILKKSGSELYIHFRPGGSDKALPGDLYRWRGVDGSEILACRPPGGWYGSEPEMAAAKVKATVDACKGMDRDYMVLWGTGDHGGGASRADLDALRRLARETDDADIKHSTPQAYLDAVKPLWGSLPVVEGDLQRCFAGCYTSLSRVKRGHRRTEGVLAQAERYAALAWWRLGMDYPADALRQAWKGLLFNEFHDILPGSCTEEGEDDAHQIFGRALDAARRARMAAQWALVRGEPAAAQDRIPIFVFNPHPWRLRAPVEAEYMLGYRPEPERVPVALVDGKGRHAPSQEERTSALLPWEWRKKIAFVADVQPMSFARYDVVMHREPKARGSALDTRHGTRGVTVENRWFRLSLSKRTGWVESLLDKANRQEVLGKPGFVPLCIDDPHDAWGTNVHEFRNVAGKFRAASRKEMAAIYGRAAPAVRVVESGPVRVVLESILTFGRSHAEVRYTAYADWPHLEVNLRIHWQERRRMLKLSLPLPLDDASATCEIPYGAIARDAEGSEHVQQRWVRVDGKAKAGRPYAVGLVNTGQYAFDLKDSELRLNILRSAVFCHHPPAVVAGDRAERFMDMGQHDVRLGLTFGKPTAVARSTVEVAHVLNVPCEAVVCFPAGGGSARAGESAVRVTPATVALGALKRSEDGQALIVRLHESVGRRTRARVQLGRARKPIELSLGPFEIKTLRVEGRGARAEVRECDLLEQTLPAR